MPALKIKKDPEKDNPAILEPPATTKEELAKLAVGLDADVPRKIVDRNLIVATWNIRAFGGMSDSWVRGADDNPKRNMSDALAIAAILSRFDVIAIQEAKDNLRALRHVLKALGPEWGLILTDVNASQAGNDERLAYVFDTRRVRPSGLAAELVLPDELLDGGKVAGGALREQFARTPYAVSFRWGAQTFILVTLHVKYGDDATDRTAELTAIAEWMYEWARKTSDEYNQNLMCLGDFNVDATTDANFAALTSTGLTPPEDLRGLTRTIFDDPGKEHYYDQIAWFVKEGRAKLTLDFEGKGHAGRFEWTKYLLTELDNVPKSWHISDHYPLWVEFGT